MKLGKTTRDHGDELTEPDDRRSETPAAPSFHDASDNRAPFAAKASGFRTPIPQSIGKYRLLEQVGRGGSGTVYRAQSSEDESIVAVKILRPEIISNLKALRRFEKEARLQAEIKSPYVTRLLDYGSQDNVHYIVSEFVEGTSLGKICTLLSQSDPRISLHIIRDVLRALDAMHSRGVVHRDVKPENVIAVFKSRPDTEAVFLSGFERAKLTDFGLARHIEQSESMAMTHQTAVLGTPMYLAPEQYSGSRLVDARADIYSLGATLFHLLAGVPPFETEDFLRLADMHREERPRPLNLVRPDISDALSNVVAKALEKQPDMRYSDAAEMLADINCVLKARPVSIRLYPAIPQSGEGQVRRYDFAWELEATASSLWPLVSDTDRVNRAMGLPAPDYVHESNPSGGRTIKASAKFNGMKLSWIEHAFQWIEGRELSVLREFDSGPFEWMTSTVELFPLIGDRSRLLHRVQVKPRGLFGRLVTPIQFGWATRRSLTKLYRRIAELARDSHNPLVCDLPFGKTRSNSRKASLIMEQKLSSLLETNVSPRLLEGLATYLLTAADAKVSRIRPKELARRFDCNDEEFLQLCLATAHEGILRMMWDLICPICRIAAETKDSIKAIAKHSYCEACHSDFEIDFNKTVELIFGVHPEIRATETRTYCIGGPFHSPHVIAQNRLQPGEEAQVGTQLTEGLYVVRGPQLPEKQHFTVKPDAIRTVCQFDLNATNAQPELAAGNVRIDINNNSKVELLARIERVAERVDATTAAEVCGNPVFRSLFPDEVVGPEQLVNLTSASALTVQFVDFEALIEQVGEVRARSLGPALKEFLTAALPQTSIDFSTNGLQIISEKKRDALAASIACYRWLGSHSFNCEIRLRFAINEGEVLIGGGNAEFFGKLTRVGFDLIECSDADHLIATESFASDPEFASFAAQNLARVDSGRDQHLKDGTAIRGYRFNLSG